jgi:adenylate cyclase
MQWTGFTEEGRSNEFARRMSEAVLEFPHEFAAGSGLLLVRKDTEPTALIETLRHTFELPYFVCVPIIVEAAPIGLLLSGRVKEAGSIFPPLDQGDVETFQAIAGLISTSVENMRIGVLQEMDRLKTDFFANISHEFRTPITLTLGPLEGMLTGRYGEVSATIRQQALVMQRNQERLLGLVNQILDLAKLEAGGMQLQAAPMPDMNRFIEERVGQFRSMAEGRGIALKVSLDPRVRGAELFIDREKFDKLLVNLLSNACKFTKQGYVEVSTELYQNAFRLTVADTGIGIKADQLPYIFDRFRQADGGASREYAGTGIGLTWVKEIAKLHGGDVTVHSQYGKGTSFRVSIPTGKTHLDPASVVEFVEEDLSALAGAPKVLIVSEGAADQEGVDYLNRATEATFDRTKPTIVYAEDNNDLRNYMRDLLTVHYNVFLAVDGYDGLEKTRQYKPDLILTDHMMPHMSGRDLLRAVRSDPALQSLPVLFLTARAGSEARIESLDAGADDYLTKPFDEGELLVRVRNILRQRAQERELAELNRQLETRVEQQVAEIERMRRLKRFFSPQLAELMFSSGGEHLLESHRREVTVVFCDLRGFTAFAETAEPEEVMGVLREYHATLGQLIFRFEGTIERFAGDGLMVFFNDPLPCPDPAARAVRMAVAIRQQMDELTERWRKRGNQLGFGAGIAQGYATLGMIGFENRMDYGAIGPVTNLASRLCGEAQDGQLLISQRVYAAVETLVETTPVGELTLKGFLRPVPAWDVVRLKEE